MLREAVSLFFLVDADTPVNKTDNNIVVVQCHS